MDNTINLTFDEQIQICDREFEETLTTIDKQIFINRQLIEKAYQFAKEFHGQEKRQSGAPYITHPKSVFTYLARVHCPTEVLVAALLHDVMEDCDVSYETIRGLFGLEVAEIVKAVTAIKREEPKGLDPEEGKLFLDRLTDGQLIDSKYQYKACLVRFADRLHNLATINACLPEKRRMKILHTEAVLIPMARKLGVYYFEIVLQDHCIRYKEGLAQTEYKAILSKRTAMLRESKEEWSLFGKAIVGAVKKHGKLAIANYNPFSSNKSQNYRVITVSEIKNELGGLPMTRQNTCIKEIVLTSESADAGTILHDYIEMHKLYLDNRGIFFEYKGTKNDAQIFVLTDAFENNYRVLILPEEKLKPFYIGTETASTISMIDEESASDAVRPTHSIVYSYSNYKGVREFKNILPKDATVLDLAFYINPKLAVTVKSAMIHPTCNDTSFTAEEHRYPLSTTLSEGEMVCFDADYYQGEERKNNKVHAVLDWFLYLKTDYAKRCFVEYLKTQKSDECLRLLEE